MIIECKNGEFVNTKTGEVLGYSDFEMFPPLSTDTNTLLRHFDGVSVEPLGTIPKIITLSNEEISLLRKLRPWDMLKYEFKQDYRKLISKINTHKLNLYQSIRMKNEWGDPNSSFNSIQRSMRLSASFKLLWADPAYRLRLSPAIREGQRKRFNNYRDREICKAQAKNAWVTRRNRYGENGFSNRPRKIRYKNDKDKMRMGERVRWGYAWKKLAKVFDMLFCFTG